MWSGSFLLFTARSKDFCRWTEGELEAVSTLCVWQQIMLRRSRTAALWLYTIVSRECDRVPTLITFGESDWVRLTAPLTRLSRRSARTLSALGKEVAIAVLSEASGCVTSSAAHFKRVGS